jgi:peptidoglycan/LPS O-acetylase OafA/YrhL
LVVKEHIDRKPYLDGLRGVAACMVLLAHLAIALDATFQILQVLSPISPPLAIFVSSSASTLWNGNFAVCIFFVLSGYVLSGLARHSPLSFPAQMVRRYVRLAIPVLLTSVLAWALLATGSYHNKEAAEIANSRWFASWYQFPPSFSDMVWRSLYTAFFSRGDAIYNPNLWTMRPEFTGSLYVFAINALAGNRYMRSAILLIWAGFHPGDYYPLFAAGALLFEYEGDLARFAKNTFGAIGGQTIAPYTLAVMGLYFSGAPSNPVDQVSRWYGWLPRFAVDGPENGMHWHSIAAILLTSAILLAPFLQAIFGSVFGRYLGRISFVLYLIQVPLICSFTSWIVIAMRDQPRLLIVAVACGATILVCLLLSTALYRLIDVTSVRLSRVMGQRLDAVMPPVGRLAGVDRAVHTGGAP